MRVLRGVLTLAFLLASVLPAYATTPIFNGNVVTGGTPVFNVTFYGAKCDGTTDDSAAIQSAITAAQNAGGGIVWLPAATCAVGSTLTVNGRNVNIVGRGGEQHHDTGLVTPATSLKWIGSSGGGPIVKFTSAGTASSQNLILGGVQNVAFLSNNGLAATGLYVLSGSFGMFENLYFDNFTGNKFYFGTVATNGEFSDDQFNFVANVSCDSPGYVDVSTTTCIYGDGGGSPAGNFSMNTVANVRCNIKVSNCIVLNNADNNLFMDVNCIEAGGGTGNCVDFKGTSSSDQFVRLTASGAVLAETNTKGNQILFYDVASNGSVTPTIQSGATLFWQTDSAQFHNGEYVQAAVGENAGNANNAFTRLGTTESMRIYNTSGDHLRLDDGTNIWGLNIDGSGNFRFSRFAGTGSISIGVPIVSTNTIKTTSSLTTGSGTAITCASGDGCFSESATTGEINLGGTTQSCYVNYGVTAATKINVGCVLVTGNGVQPNGATNGYAPELYPLGVAQPHPRMITGECAVTTPNTACTFPGSFAFADTTYTCQVTTEGTTAAAVSFAKTSTTSITIYSATSATYAYWCSR